MGQLRTATRHGINPVPVVPPWSFGYAASLTRRQLGRCWTGLGSTGFGRRISGAFWLSWVSGVGNLNVDRLMGATPTAGAATGTASLRRKRLAASCNCSRNAENESENLSRLKAWINSQGSKTVSTPIYGYFDLLWTPTLLRRNEVMLRVEAER